MYIECGNQKSKDIFPSFHVKVNFGYLFIDPQVLVLKDTMAQIHLIAKF